MDIGIKIKQLRLQCGLTQEELANRCELTKGYISQLENELTSPSIQTLMDILSALGTSLSEFFSEDKDEQVVFSKDDFFQKDSPDNTITWLVPNAQKNEMEPINIFIAPNTTLSQDMPHEGEEFGYILSGEIQLVLGKKEYTAKAGEAFYYVCSTVHYLKNNKSVPAEVLWVSSPPTF